LIPALLACYLVWGSTYLAIRFALASFPPFFQMGTRFLAAGILLMAWVLARGHKLPACRRANGATPPSSAR
jgi:drug/metabolite transporter (DMT)-like permease